MFTPQACNEDLTEVIMYIQVPGVFSTKEQERLQSLITQYGVDPKTQMQKKGVTYVSRLEVCIP